MYTRFYKFLKKSFDSPPPSSCIDWHFIVFFFGTFKPFCIFFFTFLLLLHFWCFSLLFVISKNHLSCVTCNESHVRCHMWHVLYHMWYVLCCMSHVTCLLPPVTNVNSKMLLIIGFKKKKLITPLLLIWSWNFQVLDFEAFKPIFTNFFMKRPKLW